MVTVHLCSVTCSDVVLKYVCKSVVESESEIALEWFDNKQMQANPGKFQAIATGSRTHSELNSFNVAGNAIAYEGGDSEALGCRAGLSTQFQRAGFQDLPESCQTTECIAKN